MEQKNLLRIIAAVLLVIVIINAVLFFNQLSGPISTSKAGLNMFRASMYAFMIINLVITVFLIILLWRSSRQIKEQNDISRLEETEDERQEVDNEAERRKKEEEAKAKEQKRIETKIENILSEVDEQMDIERTGKKLLSQIAGEERIVQGLFFVKHADSGKFNLKSEFAFYGEHEVKAFEEGDGLNGQVAANQEILKIDEIPEGYVKVYSGLGKSNPRHLMLIPVVKNNETIALLELASFETFDPAYKQIYQAVADKMANHLEEAMSYIDT